MKDAGRSPAAGTTVNEVTDLPYSDFMSLVVKAGVDIRTPFGIVKQNAENGEKDKKKELIIL
ncbi:hypothetical protein FQV26_01290 [Planococcus sp. CPCC 101016]|uniref:hypothetical protein n=1 Tax=Planococcus sp. CPCC 101016 TaxID=2599617 RepID=UPI0011B5DB8B|nr:hypothetical protein [Planococcus sp. CPCC 101016]TWT06477.1 hypothetical protein FQV26_01290 [Planococcus sp. CPCC 101016]